MNAGEYQRYRFGPLERRGLIGSLRPVQVIVIAFSLTLRVILMRVLSSGAGVVAALALVLVAAAFCFWPVGGRSADAWLPVIARHATATALGRHVRRSPAPNAGARLTADGRPEPIASLPEVGRDLELLAAPFHGEPVGVLKDRRTRSYSRGSTRSASSLSTRRTEPTRGSSGRTRTARRRTSRFMQSDASP